MTEYRKVTAEAIPKLPIGERVEGLFQTYIGFEVNGKHELCIGSSSIILPEELFRKYIRTNEMLEKLAYYLEANDIKSRVKGVVVEGDPMETWDDDGEHLDASPDMLAETFEPECGLVKAINEAEKITISEKNINIYLMTKEGIFKI